MKPETAQTQWVAWMVTCNTVAQGMGLLYTPWLAHPGTEHLSSRRHISRLHASHCSWVSAGRVSKGPFLAVEAVQARSVADVLRALLHVCTLCRGSRSFLCSPCSQEGSFALTGHAVSSPSPSALQDGADSRHRASNLQALLPREAP